MNENNVKYLYITSNMSEKKQILKKLSAFLSVLYYTTVKSMKSYTIIKNKLYDQKSFIFWHNCLYTLYQQWSIKLWKLSWTTIFSRFLVNKWKPQNQTKNNKFAFIEKRGASLVRSVWAVLPSCGVEDD